MSVSVSKEMDIATIRDQFPILHQQVNGKPLVYFDNAATSQKPKRVIKALSEYYERDNANIHRGIHTLAERATEAYELTRKKVAKFIGANESEEIIFTKGTTDSINLVANSFSESFLKEGDEVIISEMEHHSNIVPWQLVCERTGVRLKYISINEYGELNLDELDDLLTERTKIVSLVYISNSMGTINPVKEITERVHQAGAKILLDAAQAAPHVKLDVKELNCDFLAFSGHKMYGPTGVGVLYGKRDILERMVPYQGGGEMIKDVSLEKTTYNDIPYKFEAGTPNIADVIALSEAINFIESIGHATLQEHEQALLSHGRTVLEAIDGFIPVGTAKKRASVISFNMKDIHAFDIGMLLDAKGIAVRTGHHCTQPVMERYGIEGTVRASFAVYNTLEEIDMLASSLEQIVTKLKR